MISFFFFFFCCCDLLLLLHFTCFRLHWLLLLDQRGKETRRWIMELGTWGERYNNFLFLKKEKKQQKQETPIWCHGTTITNSALQYGVLLLPCVIITIYTRLNLI